MEMKALFSSLRILLTKIISFVLVPLAFLQSLYSDFPGEYVFDRAYYLADRYLIKTLFFAALAYKLRFRKQIYLHNGFPLQRYQGYNVYLRFKCGCPKALKKKGTPLTRPMIDSAFKVPATDLNYILQVQFAIKDIFAVNHEVGSLAPIFFKLAWYYCGTYDANTLLGGSSGGSSGATKRFEPELFDKEIMVLNVARDALEQVKCNFPEISYADLWTLAGKLAIEEMGGPTIKWLPGRSGSDCVNTEYVAPQGLLPFGNKNANNMISIRHTFTRLGLDDQETVALIGAHGLGRCYKYTSDCEGQWNRGLLRFSNEFFRVLISESWHQEIVPEAGGVQYYNHDNSLRMLNTDMELLRDPSYKIWVQEYAKDENRYFKDFAEAYAKLLDLRIRRDAKGTVILQESYIYKQRRSKKESREDRNRTDIVDKI